MSQSLSNRAVLHIDLDEFLVAVERLRRPELRGRPVVVGGSGDPTRRGVVATASYEARRFGVRSALPLRTAVRRCPQAVFLPLDIPACKEASKRVLQILAAFPGTLERAGWDEAYLEPAEGDPVSVGCAIRQAVLEYTGLSCSVGVGDNKLQAKVATDLAKPGGVFRLTSETWSAVMGGRPCSMLVGVGRKRSAALRAMGIRSVAELARADDTLLCDAFGPRLGPWLRRIAHGDSEEAVVAEPAPARSHGRETTFQRDLDDALAVREEVRRLSDEVAADLATRGRTTAHVTLKIRFAPFETHVHGIALVPPANDAAAIERAALAALDRFDLGRPVRLVGVRADSLSEH